MSDPLDNTIRENAAGPQSASGDEGSIRQHPLKDQIAADRYLSAKTAANRRHRGLRFTKLSPPGTA